MVQRVIATRLASMLPVEVQTNIHSILEIGCGTGFLTEQLIDRMPQRQMILNDLMPESASVAMLRTNHNNIDYVQADAENTNFGASFDLIASASTIQWFSNLEKFIHHCARLLNNNGIIAFSSFLPGNLKEIKSLTGVGLSYTPATDLKKMIEKDFQILTFQEEKHILHFPSPYDVLRHLSRTGVNGITSFRWTNSKLQTFIEQYNLKYKDQQGVQLSYLPVYVLAKKK
jgi:biotin biosynthesis protein BioC